jgi:hypothetical protein
MQETQYHYNRHQYQRASSKLISFRIFKTSLAFIFVYAIISQYLVLRQWASQSSISVTDDDTPSDFFWSDTDDPTATANASDHHQSFYKILSEKNHKTNTTQLPLNLIPKKNLNFLDQFSDSWLLNKKSFLNLNVDTMPFVEQACFQVMSNREARMFVDWTDFMVEHMSKWWGELRIMSDADSAMFDHTIAIFHKFVVKKCVEHQTNRRTTKSALHETIAMIAFQAYRSVHKGRGHKLSYYSLAATLGSLLNLGCGRILVVGYNAEDMRHVEVAFQLLKSVMNEKNEIISTNMTIAFTIGQTELAYVRIPNQSWVKTSGYAVNMPKGTLQGMQLAIQGRLNHRDHNTTIDEWLGTAYNASYWKYFYLTEPDTILHTKRQLLPSLRQGLDEGMMFLPHRLQPLPHEFNLPAAEGNEKKNHDKAEEKHISDQYKGRFIPGDVHPFSNITFLDPLNSDDHCCDAGAEWPGRSEEFGEKQFPCETWWWACSYSDKHQIRNLSRLEILEKNKRLIPYPMMSLRSGTGVIIGPSEQGRRCFPSKTPCAKAESSTRAK